MNLRKGFSLVELLIAIVIASIIMVSTAQIVVISIDSFERERHIIEAIQVAEEGIEAVRAMRNNSWSANIQPLLDGVNYYPVISGNNWSLSSVNPGWELGRYDRAIQFSQVFRNSSDNISASGDSDPDTRKLTVTAGWRERGATTTVVFDTYLTNFLQN